MAARRDTTITDTLRAAVVLVGTAALLGAVVAPIPVGGALWIIAATVGIPFPRPEVLMPDSSLHRASTFARALSRNAVVPKRGSLGFGDPGTADGHTRCAKPRNRVSSWVALGGAGIAALADIGLSFLPFRHHWATALVTVPFAYVAFQSVAHARRDTAVPGDVAPAALFDRDTNRLVHHKVVVALGAGLVAGGAGGAAIHYGIGALLDVPVTTTVAVATAGGVTAAVLSWARRYNAVALAAWHNDIQNRDEWRIRWEVIPKVTNPPVWIVQFDLPQGGHPTHTQATFAIPGGTDFATFEEAAPKLGPALGSDTVLVTPMPALDENGRPIPGSAQYSGFHVVWATAALGQHAHLRGDLDPQTHKFVVKHRFVDAFKSLGLGRPELAGLRSLASPDSPGSLFETQWRLAPGMTFDRVAAKATSLQEKLEAPWLRVGRRLQPDGQASDFVSIVYGQDPDRVTLQTRNAAAHRAWLDQLDWSAWLRASKLVGTTGQPPRLVEKYVNPRGIAEMEFTLADGLSVADVKKLLPQLMATSGHGYIAVEQLDDASRFRMVAGRKDPLEKSYLFMDYATTLLVDPVPGRPRLDWAIGLGADGEMLVYRWDAELPHLLVAGGSGMGKSSAINGMILQMCHNTAPHDLDLWLVEPKNELNQFSSFAHVTHFVDQQTPGDFLENVANVMGELRAEMDARYSVMARHPARPLKLSDARFIANREDPRGDGSRHPLDLPYIVCVIEECASVFARPSQKRLKEAHEVVLDHVTELARKARAAGIYLVLATQYPTNESLPSTIRQQCRRLGLGVSTTIASMVIIDEPGLEAINTPGRGLISWGKAYREFRALFLRKPDEASPDVPDDRIAVAAGIEQVNGRVFGGGGAAAPSAPPPPPPGIWETVAT